MALGQCMTVVRVEGVDQRRARIGGAGRGDTPAVEDHAGAGGAPGAELPRGLTRHDPGQIGAPAAGRDADEIDEAAPSLVHHGPGQVGEGQVLEELYDVLAHRTIPVLRSPTPGVIAPGRPGTFTQPPSAAIATRAPTSAP